MSIQSGKSDRGSLDCNSMHRFEEYDLAESIKSVGKAEFELDEILNDPYLAETRQEVASMMISYKKKETSGEIETFIKQSLTEKNRPAQTSAQINKSDIDDLSAEWVREWHRKKQMEVFSSPAAEERKQFIISSLAEEQETAVPAAEAAQTTPVTPMRTKKAYRKTIIKYTSIAAAAVLGIFISFRALVPAGDTEKIFRTFYQTYPGVSETTRGGNNDFSTSYESALNYYKSGQYHEAETGFTKAIGSTPSNASSLFYLGIAQIETGNIDQAINNLSSASNGPGRFNKEAQWYLGLAYLKKGDRVNAEKCFSALASGDGFYREPSEKILRRLK